MSDQQTKNEKLSEGAAACLGAMMVGGVEDDSTIVVEARTFADEGLVVTLANEGAIIGYYTPGQAESLASVLRIQAQRVRVARNIIENGPPPGEGTAANTAAKCICDGERRCALHGGGDFGHAGGE